MNQEWLVDVRDPAGAPLAGAEVALFAFDDKRRYKFPYTDVAPTHVHAGAGRFKPAAPLTVTEGPWHLVVRHPDRSPVIQPLTMTKLASGEMRASPKAGLLMTVAPTTERIRSKSAVVLSRTVFDVELHPAAEYVYLSGTEYGSAGTQFRKFAEGRREMLARSGVIGPGSLVVLLSCDEARLDILARTRGPERWSLVYRLPKAPAPPTPQPRPNAFQDVSITDLYGYLSEAAVRAPGSVKEVGIFSHSYPGGPILFNTRDGTGNPVGPRDPNDFDGRAKDFQPANVSSWPKLNTAMAPDGRWIVFGCRATVHLNRTAQAAFNQRGLGTPRARFFTVRSAADSHGTRVETTTERLNLDMARTIFEAAFRTGYLAAAWSLLGIDVWGAPPGLGASFVRKGKIELMRVDANHRVNGYLSHEMGPAYVRNPDGYVNYRKLLAKPARPRPPFSSDYFCLTEHHRGSSSFTTIKFWNAKRWVMPEIGFKHEARRVDDLTIPGMSGVLHVLEKGSPTGGAVYAQDDGVVREIGKDPITGKFTVPGAFL